MASLKSLFKNLFRKAGGYTDDVARLASNYGDEALDYSVDLARVVDRYDDDVARAFNSNVDAATRSQTSFNSTVRDIINDNNAIFNNLRQNALDVPVNLSNNTINKLMGVSNAYGNPIGIDDWSTLLLGTDRGFSNDIVAHNGNKKLRNWLRNQSTSHSGNIMTPEWFEFLNEDIF